MPNPRALSVLSLLAYAGLVWGHARVTSPPIRSPGNNFLQQCGQTSFNAVQGDPTGHIEQQEPVPAGCVLTLCRGMPFSDQPASNVQNVTPGQQMTMDVQCTVPHGGPANVSLLDVTAGGNGVPIGSFLKTFDDFCPTSGPTPADQTNLQFNLPDASTVGNKCQKAGDCVVQLFWSTPDFSQNYFYCVDVAMANAVVSTSSTAATSAVTPSAPITTGSASNSSGVISPTSSPAVSGLSTSVTGTGTGTNTALSSSQTHTSGARRGIKLFWMEL